MLSLTVWVSDTKESVLSLTERVRDEKERALSLTERVRDGILDEGGDDVVVRERGGEEVGGGPRGADYDLGAAEIRL